MLIINDKVTYRKVEDSILVITPWDNAMHTVEDVGLYIFESLIDEKSKDLMLKEIVDSYEIEENIAEKDLNEFIGSLIEKEIFIEGV